MIGFRGLSGAAGLSHALPRLQPQVESWTTSTLDAVVWADILGTDVAPMSRADAMAVPAVARARHLTAGALAKLPLKTYRTDVEVAAPYWAQGSDGQLGTLTGAQCDLFGVARQSTWQRTLDTVDDHLFYGESLWLVTDLDLDGRPRRMIHVPWSRWELGPIEALDGQIGALDQNSEPITLPWVYLPGPHEGILNFAQRTIRSAAALEITAADVARRPFRLELHQTTDIELTAAERAELVGAARSALADNNGVLFTNAAIETVTHSLDSGDLLIAGRNASALDIARDVSMPAAMLDATTAGASLEYATTVGRNQLWIDYGLSLYSDAFTARLSMDDILPAGQRTAFDMDSLTAPVTPPAGPPTTD